MSRNQTIARSVGALALAVALMAAPNTASAADLAHPAPIRGVLSSGGAYVLHEPAAWNGTVLVWSPGYGGGGQPNADAAPSQELLDWALDEGYALAGTSTLAGGWSVEDLQSDQRELVDVIEDGLGDADDVIAWGESMGGLTSAALMEAHPDVFDAALPLCGSVAGAVPMLNGALDGTFVFKELIAPDDDAMELVHVEDESARQAAFAAAIERAQSTSEGRARLALAASVAQIPTWTQPDDERPGRHDIREQQEQLYAAFQWGVVSPRQPLEERAGGNFSWNTGVDYGRSLIHSGNARLVRELYREAGVSLRDDLGALARAERISADPRAVAYMRQNATPTGEISGPVLTVHQTGDTAPTAAQAGTYADRVRSAGAAPLLRQTFIDVPGHCGYADAQVAALLTALQTRLDTGRWGATTTAKALNASAERISADSGLDQGDDPFARYAPDRMLRPERGTDG
ncbi:alpha/beta hydrolase family protein [Microbacterium sp. JB110]|uniref:alpha/beta hydrolase family protein n=1 Tax=Microbacterium sp. JB110 TaxID=2024477 RepID=UPI00097E9D56|nr:prolyl oligopeptidase family serine peptidase [Microbacterium sp. JB110]RCS62236.1 hypothetical protein CIK77_06080 [Microbacterium sp. JB110]SJM44404.1 putative membrane protein [Frigoribacterium sp. JB110]